MQSLEYRLGDCFISTSRKKLDLKMIHEYLSTQSYWAQGRPFDVVKRGIENSLCFGMYDSAEKQIGFARIVTDYATFGWLCDVFVIEGRKGEGLGKWLVKTIVECPELRGIKRIMLATKDAHVLYRRYGGFESLKEPSRWMERSGDAGAQ